MYNNSTWVSEPVDLNVKGHGIHNEHIVTFHDQITSDIVVRKREREISLLKMRSYFVENGLTY